MIMFPGENLKDFNIEAEAWTLITAIKRTSPFQRQKNIGFIFYNSLCTTPRSF